MVGDMPVMASISGSPHPASRSFSTLDARSPWNALAIAPDHSGNLAVFAFTDIETVTHNIERKTVGIWIFATALSIAHLGHVGVRLRCISGLAEFLTCIHRSNCNRVKLSHRAGRIARRCDYRGCGLRCGILDGP